MKNSKKIFEAEVEEPKKQSETSISPKDENM